MEIVQWLGILGTFSKAQAVSSTYLAVCNYDSSSREQPLLVSEDIKHAQ